MTKQALLLLAIFALFLVGGVLGFFARRHEERVVLPPARVRPAWLRQALKDYEQHPTRALVPSPPDSATITQGWGSDEDHAESLLLWGLQGRGTSELERVEQEHPGSQAAGRALWEAIQRTTDDRRRAKLLALFRERHPDAWVLRGADGRGGVR